MSIFIIFEDVMMIPAMFFSVELFIESIDHFMWLSAVINQFSLFYTALHTKL